MENFDLRLNKLVLKNYKGFYTGDDEKGVEITFDKKLTVLIGDNGSGKSSILEAISLFLMKLRSDISDVHEKGGIYPFPMPSNEQKNKDVNNNVDECFLSAVVSLSPKEYFFEEGENKPRSSKVGFSIHLEKDKSPNKIDISKWADHNKEKEENPFDVDETEYNDKRTLDLFLSRFYENYRNNEVENIPILAFYGANSINTSIKEDGQELLSSIFDAFENALKAVEFSFKQFFLWFDDQQRKDLMRKGMGASQSSSKNVVKISFINEAFQKMLNDEEITFENLFIDWQSTPYEMKVTKKQHVKNKNIKLEDTSLIKENLPLTINQLSSGEKTLLALVVDITRRLCLANPYSQNPLEGNGIVLIDEIDVHLHPKWQRKVVSKLREIFPNIQFIVTTHSPELLKGLNKKHLRILKNRRVISKIPHIEGRDSNAILEDIFDVSRRPEEYEEKLLEFYRLVDDNKTKARAILNELRELWGETDEEIVRAESYFEIF